MRNSTPVYFPKTIRLKEEISEIGAKAVKELYEVKDLVPYLNEVFRKEYSEYLSKGEFFPGCPFELYEKHYESRLQEYWKTYPDADEFDFLKEEDSLFWSLSRMDVEAKDNFYNFYPHLYSKPHRLNITLSIDKMRSFIDKRIEELGHNFYAPGFDDPFDIPVNLPRRYWEPRRNSDVQNSKKQEEVIETIPRKESVIDGIEALKDWFRLEADFNKVFFRLSHIFEVNENEIRYTGSNSEVKAVCYLIVILQKFGYLKKNDRKRTQKKMNNIIRTAFKINFSEPAFSQFKHDYDEDDPCSKDIKPHISSL